MRGIRYPLDIIMQPIGEESSGVGQAALVAITTRQWNHSRPQQPAANIQLILGGPYSYSTLDQKSKIIILTQKNFHGRYYICA